MNSHNRNEALSDLQELHSAVNYIKQKLNATGQKLDAASSSGLVQLDLSGLPYHHPQTNCLYHQESNVPKDSALWNAEQRNAQNVRRLDAHVGRQGRSRSRERNYTLVDPVCINKKSVPSDHFSLPKGLRPNKSSNYRPGASAITSTSGKVSFSDVERNPRLEKTACCVTEAHYINNDETRQFLSDSNSVLPGASDKLRKVVERQRDKAERRQGRTTRHSRERTSPPQGGTRHGLKNIHESAPLADCCGTCIEEGETRWASVSAGTTDKVDQVTRKKRIKQNVRVHHHRSLHETSVGDDCVEDYLKFLRLRVEEKERETAEDISVGLDRQGNHSGHHSPQQLERRAEPRQECRWERRPEDNVATSANHQERRLEHHLEHNPDDYLEQDLKCHPEHRSECHTECHQECREEYDPKHCHEEGESKNFPMSYPAYELENYHLGGKKASGLILKRKMVSMPQPFGYKGFALSGSPKARRKVHRHANQPSCTKEPPSKEDVVLKTGTNEKNYVTRSSKQSVITPSSWKVGRDLVLKKHGPPPGAVKRTLTKHSETVSQEATNNENSASSVSKGCTEGHESKAPSMSPDELAVAAPFARSHKRKAVQQMPKDEEQPSAPATKARPYDPSVVREFISKQRLGRRQQERSARSNMAEAAQLREQRLEKLYAFQRRTATVSAQKGRWRLKEEQKEAELVEQLVKSLRDAERVVCTEKHEVDHVSKKEELNLNKQREGKLLVGEEPPCHSGMESAKLLSNKATQVGSFSEGPSSRDPEAGAAAVRGSPGQKSQRSPKVNQEFYLQLKELLDVQQPEHEFLYKPTEQVIRLEKLTTDLNNKIEDEFQRMECNLPEVFFQTDAIDRVSIIERLQQMVSALGMTEMASPVELLSMERPETRSTPGPGAHKKVKPAKTMQHFWMQEILRSPDSSLQEATENIASSIPGAQEAVAVAEKAVSPPSINAFDVSVFEESSHHLMPYPNNIARAWNKKNTKGFLTSTLSEGKLSIPNFSISALDSHLLHSHPPEKISSQLSPNERKSERTSGEVRSSLLESSATSGRTEKESQRSQEDKHSVPESSPVAQSGGHLAARNSATETDHLISHVKPPSEGSVSVEKYPVQESLVLNTPAPSQAALTHHSTVVSCKQDMTLPLSLGQDLGLRKASILSEKAAEADSTNATVGRSNFRSINFKDDRAWIVLEAQAKAAQASAETARQLVQARIPSEMERQSEDLARLLTASTVAAASALAASIGAHKIAPLTVQVPIKEAPKHESQKSSSSPSSSSMTASHISSFESDGGTSVPATTNESRSPLPPSKETNVTEERHPEAGMTDGWGSGQSSYHEKDASSDSVSEELGALGISDSSLGDRREVPRVTKKSQPKNLSPLSVDSSATEDSKSGGRAFGQGSSTGDPILLDKDLLSYGSLTEPTWAPGNFPTREDVAGEPSLALLRLQERGIVDKARAELAWLEVLKRNCRENGTDDKMPALRKRQRAILIRLKQKRLEVRALQSRCLARTPKKGAGASIQEAISVPTSTVKESTDSSISEQVEASFHSDHASQSFVEELSALEKFDKTEENAAVQDMPTLESSSSFLDLQEDSAHLKLNASKRLLEQRQQELQTRRKNVQDLLEWQKKLNMEEASVRALERRALARLRTRGAKVPQGKLESSVTTPPLSSIPAEMTTRQSVETKSSDALENMSVEEDIPDDTADADVTITESVLEEGEVDEQTSAQQESTIENNIVASGSSEAEVSTQMETQTKRSRKSSPRSSHLLSGKSALLIKSPLVSRMKPRRDSSGSEDSFNVSLSETASDQSDIESRILALSEELKKRQFEAVQLKKEQRRRHTEFLREKEQSLRRHIEVYDQLIQQAKEELEKELDLAQHEKSVCVKPQIKKPRATEQRKHRLPQHSPDRSLQASPSVTPSKHSEARTESLGEKSGTSSGRSEPEVLSETISKEAPEATSSVDEASSKAAALVSDGSKAVPSEKISEQISEEIAVSSVSEQPQKDQADASVSSAKEPSVSASEMLEESYDGTTSESASLSFGNTETSSSSKRELSANDSLNLYDNEAAMSSQEPADPPIIPEEQAVAAENVAEYMEETVLSIIIKSPQLPKSELQDENRVERLVESIFTYLLNDTACSLQSTQTKPQVVQHAPESDVWESKVCAEKTTNFALCEGVSEEIPVQDIDMLEKVIPAVIKETEEEPLKAVDTKQHAWIVEEKATLETWEDEQTRQEGIWNGSELDTIADKMVFDAVQFMLNIMREKGRLAALSADSSEEPHVSDVSRKVSEILASIEEKRNSRELPRPQDLMVLSTDLDEDDFPWKDAPTSCFSSQEPPETNKKELCSRAVQAEDSLLSTTVDQDWFDDDFGLGSPSADQLFAYHRRIPNKPPPPYSAPRGLPRMPLEPPWSVPREQTELSRIVQRVATVVYEAVLRGEDLKSLHYDTGMVGLVLGAGASMDAVETESCHCYYELLFDLAKELAEEMFCLGAPEVTPPWQSTVRLQRKLDVPATQERFVCLLEEKMLLIEGLHGVSEPPFGNLAEAANVVDTVLFREVRKEEPEWTDYSQEELAVKEQASDAIFLLLLDDTVEELKAIWGQSR